MDKAIKPLLIAFGLITAVILGLLICEITYAQVARDFSKSIPDGLYKGQCLKISEGVYGRAKEKYPHVRYAYGYVNGKNDKYHRWVEYSEDGIMWKVWDEALGFRGWQAHELGYKRTKVTDIWQAKHLD